MINVSKTFRRNLYEGNNKFLMRLVITLQDDTQLEVQNDNIMSNSGILIDDAVSEDDDFTALGSAIINACDVILYNNTNLYSNYEFINAKVVVYVGLRLGENNVEEFKKGTYTVDDAVYGEYTVTLSLVDEMAQFDRPYSESQLAYPATLNSIILNACSICNVPLATSSLQFPHRDFSVPNRPSGESTTFREVIGWVATLAGCFARCNVDGELELKWFDINSLDAEQEAVYDGGTINPWSTGNTVDGGTFNPWSTGDTVDGGAFTDTHNVHYISSLHSQSLGVDDVVITGVRITVEIDDVESDEDTKVFMQGTDGYVIDIADNKFITEDNATTILTWLATLLIGTRFRKCNIQHPTDPTIEAGDIALLWDTKDVEHRILITRVDFSPTRLQTVISGAAPVGRNSATRFSSQTKSYVETRRQLREQKDSYDDALERLAERVDSSSGLYETDVTQQDSSVIKYYHNKPQLSESDIQIVISDVGITVTSNGTDTNPTWYGLTVDGNLITSILNTVGINADWIVTGTIQDQAGKNNWNLITGLLSINDGSIETSREVGNNTGKIVIDGGAITFYRDGVEGASLTPFQYTTYRDNYGNALCITYKDAVVFGRVSGNSYSASMRLVYGSDSIARLFLSSIVFEGGNSSFLNIKGGSSSSAKGMYFTNTAAYVTGYLYALDNFYNEKALSNTSTYRTVTMTATGLLGVTSSSKRWKENIHKVDETDARAIVDGLLAVDVVRFQYKEGHVSDEHFDYSKPILGLIAEDVYAKFPDGAIVDAKDETLVDDWDFRKIIPALILTAQEQKQKIDELEDRITRLETLLLKEE